MLEITKALRELGLKRIPTPRAAAPPPRAGIEDAAKLFNFRKALSCVDPLDTASFSRYIPEKIVIDHSLDPRRFVPGWTYAICVPTDVPVPSNDVVYRATGISSSPTKRNFYLELAGSLLRAYNEYGARAMSRPLIFRTSGYQGTRPLMGVIVTFDRTPPEGCTQEDIMARVGVLAEHDDLIETQDEAEAAELNSGPGEFLPKVLDRS